MNTYVEHLLIKGTQLTGKMVATSVWIPGAGTISITNIEHPFNPLLGSLSFDTDSPFQQITKINRGNIPLDSPASVTPADVIDQYLSLESITDVASLCNLATIVNRESGEWSARGDPTECALQVLACRFPHKGRALLAETDSPIWCEFAVLLKQIKIDLTFCCSASSRISFRFRT